MARFEVTAPDGSRYEVSGPDDATEEQVMSFAASQWKPKKEEKKDVPINARDVTRKALQGATFGGSDEIGSALTATIAPVALWAQGLPNDRSWKEEYNASMGKLKKEREAFSDSNPKTALAAELAGGLATGSVGASKMLGAKAIQGLSPLAKTAVVSGIEGGIYGGLSADQGERGKGAATGAAGAAVLGPAMQLGGRTIANVASPVVDRAKSAVFGTPERDARRYLATVLSREGVNSIDDLAVKAGGKDALLADVSEGARGALEGLVSDVNSPKVRALAKKTLESRNAAQPSRLFASLDAKFGINPDMTVKSAVDAVKKSRQASAAPLYAKAKESPLMMTPYMKAVLSGDRAVPELKSAMNEAVKRTATKRATGDKVSHIDVVDEMKRVLDDKIGGLMRTGEKNRARDLIIVKNKILADVDKQIPAYKAARDSYAGDSAMIDAAEMGKKILREDVDHLDDIVAGMSKSEKEMFTLGAKKAIREKLMMGREGTNTANRIASEMNLERMKRAFPDEKSFNQFKSDLDFEAKIFDTSKVLHNSMTALRQSAQKGLDSGGIDAPDMNIGNDTAGIIAGGLKKLFTRKLSPEARDELGAMLLTPISKLDPSTASKLNRDIVNQLPRQYKAQYLELIKRGRQGAESASAALPAVAIPALENQ